LKEYKNNCYIEIMDKETKRSNFITSILLTL
jgi:hypothetical protein